MGAVVLLIRYRARGSIVAKGLQRFASLKRSIVRMMLSQITVAITAVRHGDLEYKMRDCGGLRCIALFPYFMYGFHVFL